MNLRPETLRRIDEVIPHYPVKRSAVLMLLHAIQEDVGYIPDDAIPWVAEKLELEPINVYEVVTFYPMFRPKRGEVSPDGEVTVEFVECLASCGTAPVVMIDDDLHEKVDCAKAKQLSDQIKAEAAQRR